MKNCPFCAEEIQDAAIFCKHCGRDLTPLAAVTSAASTGKTKRMGCLPMIGIAVAGLFALIIGGMIVERISPSLGNQRDSDGKCVLHARATVVTRDTPIAQALHWDTDVLAIRSLDAADWNDLEVTAFGFETTGTYGKRPTGRYKLKKGAAASRGKLMAFDLKDFEKASGERWVPLTMNVEGIELKASRRGESCAADIRPTASVSEVIGR